MCTDAPQTSTIADPYQIMYLALTYDHRLLDGREAVTFLVKVGHALDTEWRESFGARMRRLPHDELR